jgi:hypothetical protein
MKSGGPIASAEFESQKSRSLSGFLIHRTNMPNSSNTSTGPRTDAGKAVSRMNSLKHGLTAKTVVLRGENQDDFDRLHNQLLADHAPVGALETELVAEIAACLWRLQRTRRYESTILETSSFELFVSHTQAKGFETLMRYMAAIERQLNRAIVRLRETQSERRKRPEPARTMSATTSPATTYTTTQFVSPLTTDLTTDNRQLTTQNGQSEAA